MLKVLSIFFILLPAAISASTSCQLSIQAQHYPPRFIKQQNTDGKVYWQGFNAELFHLLAKNSGCEANYIEVPWGRALQLLASGELDAMSNMSHNPERDSYAYFVGPHQQERILVLSNSPGANLVKDLSALLQSGQAISVMQGIYYGEQFEQALARDPDWSKRLIYVSSSQQKLDLFIAGRVQFTFEDSLNLQQLYLEGVLNPQQHKLAFTLHQNSVYFAFSKQSVTLPQLRQLQQAWQKITADGSLDKLKNQYFPDGQNQ
ncbi:ABC transporter substrate-binding protein [Rheinheimera sp.]|uniref:substrate-binding periplasmic protein n=1 Tax=Rheinheimera sp. TaxID=1869214 RepID=UPI00273488A5|nr:transporter substrate-binding domain-containing protein [Rheinheimera sp.]MDP2714169.1 transporter substrate-binding domain-containing protein [Rheinheimera sp.]